MEKSCYHLIQELVQNQKHSLTKNKSEFAFTKFLRLFKNRQSAFIFGKFGIDDYQLVDFAGAVLFVETSSDDNPLFPGRRFFSSEITHSCISGLFFLRFLYVEEMKKFREVIWAGSTKFQPAMFDMNPFDIDKVTYPLLLLTRYGM